ncbi:glycosyltransferase family 8 protein [Butyrivibrio sp. FC2001]|uniref:glycosyltransferase family 8 protein n=1 Tax=Butyrivibrio sp. FC2001 TaxID=1280671 RepID=UPI000424373D|nr:glycosyltransferase family 8 protein [Butyrivibrio sp. FC2001]
MTIVYVSDDNYAHLLGISLTSLYENNKLERTLNVFIIDDGISQNNKQKIVRTAARYDREIKFFDVDISLSLNNMGKWPKNIFYRLFFLSIFGNELKDDRILYLDCDTIVVDRVGELWDIDMKGKACAAVYECMGKRHKKNCCLKDELPYFNSGVLLIDVNKWKEQELEEKVQKILSLNSKTRMEYPDEGIINYLLIENIMPLNPRYNLTTIKCVFTFKELKMYRKSKIMYAENDYYEAKDRPCIIHYTSNFLVRRPWQEGMFYEHPLAQKYLEYEEKSEWKRSYMSEEHLGLGKLILRKLFRIDGMLCAIIAGFIYSYIKPLQYDILSVPKNEI